MSEMDIIKTDRIENSLIQTPKQQKGKQNDNTNEKTKQNQHRRFETFRPKEQQNRVYVHKYYKAIL